MSTEARALLEQAGPRTVHDAGFASACMQKWAPLLESTHKQDPIQMPYVKKVTAVLLENEMEHLKDLQEDTLSNNTGYFTKYVFPILRNVWPNLIANQIVSVQPMTSPVSGVFYYDKKYANRKGQMLTPSGPTGSPLDMNYDGELVAGTTMRKNFGRNYAREFVDYDVTCTDTGTGVATLSNSGSNCRLPEWSPIRDVGVEGQRTFFVKAYFSILDADDSDAVKNVVATLDTTGATNHLIDDLNSNNVGTFNVATGAWTITPLGSAGNASDFNTHKVIYFQYFVNWELVGQTSGAKIPSVSLDITLKTVQAEDYALKADWSVQAVDDMRALHGMDVEQEIVSTFSNEVMLEVDRNILAELMAGAAHSATYTYSSSVPGEVESIREMITKISAMSARIHKTSERAPANFIVTSPAIQALLDQLSTHGDYASIEQNTQASTYGVATANYGISRVGTLLRKWAVYVDPYMEENKILIGLKGNSFLDAGYVYAPYVPLQVTPTFLDPDTQRNKKGIRTRHATRMLRAEYYGVITVSGLPSITTDGGLLNYGGLP